MCVVTSYYRLEEAYIVDINITVFNQLKKASQTLSNSHRNITRSETVYNTCVTYGAFFILLLNNVFTVSV